MFIYFGFTYIYVTYGVKSLWIRCLELTIQSVMLSEFPYQSLALVKFDTFSSNFIIPDKTFNAISQKMKSCIHMKYKGCGRIT